MAFVAALLGAVKAIRFLERWFDAFSASLLRFVMLLWERGTFGCEEGSGIITPYHFGY